MFIVVFVASLYFSKFSDIFIGLFTLVFIPYLTLKLININLFIKSKNEIKRLRKEKKPGKLLLFEWLGKADFDNDFVLKVSNYTVQEDLLDNLKEIKKQIKNKVGPNLSDYVLLKDYLELHSKNNLLNKFNTVFFGAGSVILTGIITKALTTDKAITNFYNIFTTNEGSVTGSFAKFLYILTNILIATAVLIYIYSESTKEKRRIEMIKIIINNIIEEKEGSFNTK